MNLTKILFSLVGSTLLLIALPASAGTVVVAEVLDVLPLLLGDLLGPQMRTGLVTCMHVCSCRQSMRTLLSFKSPVMEPATHSHP